MVRVHRRLDLAEFLRARRSALDPAAVGLLEGPRRRTKGLRREEVAMLAGVSVSWYTWLEQGRPINASLDVLDALARALRLDPVERDHLIALAGHPARRPTAEPNSSVVPSWAPRLLAALEPAPSYLLGPWWDYLAWNEAHERLLPLIASLEPHERNLVWVVFALPEVRDLIVDWEEEARRVLSQFRADITPIRNEPEVLALVERLRAASTDFAAWWDRHDVAGFQTRIRRFRHARAGLLTFEYQQLVAAGSPDLRIVVHLPVPGDDSQERLASLV
jgi:transcriptional regulator with XRE-family HTH domain